MLAFISAMVTVALTFQLPTASFVIVPPPFSVILLPSDRSALIVRLSVGGLVVKPTQPLTPIEPLTEPTQLMPPSTHAPDGVMVAHTLVVMPLSLVIRPQP